MLDILIILVIGFATKVVDLEDFSADTLQKEKFSIFITATYGEGEPTDNARSFHKWLKKTSRGDDKKLLAGLSYCVFGLGNRQYEKFNEMGKDIDARLERIGANRLVPIGLGDDDKSMEVLYMMCSIYNLPYYLSNYMWYS